MNIEKIRQIVNSGYDDRVCEIGIIQILAADPKVVPTILEILEHERKQSKELLLDTNERLSVAFLALTKHSDGTRINKSYKEWVANILSDTQVHFHKWKNIISCNFNMKGLPNYKE